MTAEIINLDIERRKRWIEKLERARELGEVAIFGAIGEHDAQVIYLPTVE